MHQIIKADGTLENFDPEKLRHSLKEAGVSLITIEEIVEEVTKWLVKPATTHEIYHKAFSILRHKKDEKAPMIKYSLRRSIAEFGPTGFPFERFVASILDKKGYSTITGVIIQGKCVDHEVDVVAWDKDSLIFSEVKFHSELDSKSDLKVALYIKSRFDDLKDSTYSTSHGVIKMTNGLLITNTKFTEKAIAYGVCAGVNMIGWNYPLKGNLHHLINETGVHPVTCLPSLTSEEKRFVVSKGVVDCESFKKRQEIWHEMPSIMKKKDEILDDILSICGC
jgi:predicted nucleic acid-binding protein